MISQGATYQRQKIKAINDNAAVKITVIVKNNWKLYADVGSKKNQHQQCSEDSEMIVSAV